MNVNFGLTANDYVKHRAGFSGAFLDPIFSEGIIKSGDTRVDSLSEADLKITRSQADNLKWLRMLKE